MMTDLLTFEVEIGTRHQLIAARPAFVAAMAADLIDAGTDVSNFDAVVFELLARGIPSRVIAACVDDAIKVVNLYREKLTWPIQEIQPTALASRRPQ